MAMEENLGPQFNEHASEDNYYDDSFARNLRPQRTPGGLIAMPHLFTVAYLGDHSSALRLVGKRSGGYSTCCAVIARTDRNPKEWGLGRDLQEAEGEGGYPSMRAALAAADSWHEDYHERFAGEQ